MTWVLFLVLFAGGESTRFPLETDDFALQPWFSANQVGPHGEIYLADMAENTIRVFNEKGEHLRDIGRRGKGPGEFQRWFGVFSVVGERLYQVDYFGGNRFINVFSLDGKLIETLPLKDIAVEAGTNLLMPIGEDRLFIAFDHKYRGTKNGPLYFLGPTQVVGLMDRSGKLVKTFHETKADYEISFYPDREGRALPGSNGTMVAVNTAKNLIALQVSNASTGVLMDMTTGKTRSFKNGFKPVPVTEDSIDTLRKERQAFIPAAFREYENKLYKTLIGYHSRLELYQSTVEHLFFSTDGRLVLVGQKQENGQIPLHLVDPDSGKLISKSSVPFGPFHVTADRIYGIHGDEGDDVYYLVIAKR